MADIIVWAAIGLAFFVAEGYAIWNAHDGFQPLTYHLRNLFRLKDRGQPLYWIAGGLIAWLGYHFLIASS